MRHLIPIFSMLLLSSCAQLSNTDSFGQDQQFTLNLPKQTHWFKQFEETHNNGVVKRKYFPWGESNSHWSQAFVETYYPTPLYHNRPALLLKQEKLNASSVCQQTAFKSLSTLKYATTFTMNGSECKINQEIFITGKIMQGKNGLYMVQYLAAPNKVQERSIQFGMNSVMASRLSP